MTYSEWHAREKRLIKLADQAVDLFMDAWFDLKTHPDWNGRMSATSDQHFALATLVARQVRFLDAARASAVAGSPEAVTVLNRCMFETWLSILAIGFYRDKVWTPEKLGQRFLAHGDFIGAHRAAERKADLYRMARERGIAKTVVDSLLTDLDSRERVPRGTFKRVNEHWYPFQTNGRGGTGALANALWPEGRRKKFPNDLFPLSRRAWLDQLDIYWGHPSDIVHGSGYSASNYIRPDESGLVHDERHYDAEGALRALCFGLRSILAVAEVIGMAREWEMTSHRTFRHYERIQSRLRPYLVIEDPNRI